VDTPNGLLVPVIRDADRRTVTEIAVELGALSQKARDRKLSLEEMSGGVFSISNLGGIGGTAFTPIVNQPEVAILGVSRGSREPVWTGTEFVPREMLPLSLSYDHRVIDGADAARFLRFVAEALEQPMALYL
jgi:pyruvate dehydrogenase E2 component (dihydrolipoamide acetyltransferase)